MTTPECAEEPKPRAGVCRSHLVTEFPFAFQNMVLGCGKPKTTISFSWRDPSTSLGRTEWSECHYCSSGIRVRLDLQSGTAQPHTAGSRAQPILDLFRSFFHFTSDVWHQARPAVECRYDRCGLKEPGKAHSNLGLLCTEEQRFSGTQKEVKAARPCLFSSRTQLPLRTRKKQRREIGNLKPAGFLAVKRINSDFHPTTKHRSQGTMQGRHHFLPGHKCSFAGLKVF